MEPFVPGSRRERERERHYEKQPASSAGRDDSPFISEPLGREPQRYYALSEEERYRASGRRRSRVEYEDDEHDVERERERNERRFVLDDDYRRRGSIASLGSGPGAEGYLSPPRSPRSIGSHVNGEPPRKRVEAGDGPWPSVGASAAFVVLVAVVGEERGPEDSRCGGLWL
jgi:hypothetical protein